MIYFNLMNPFTLAPSLGYLIVWAIKTCIFYPIFFLGTYKHLHLRRIPFYFYLIIAVGALFLPFFFFLNDLIWIIVTIVLIYFLVDHGTGSLTDLVAGFGYSMLVYYFVQTIVSGIIAIFEITLLPSTGVYYLITNTSILICYTVTLPIIRATRPFFNHYLSRLRDDHALSEWPFSLAFLPIAYFLYYTQYYRRLTLPPVLPESAPPVANYLATLAKYTSQLEVMTDDLRRFRHDYQNILYSLSSALKTNNLDYAKRALGHLTRDTQRDIKVPTGIIGPLKNIKDSGVKAVIYNKISVAMDKELNLEIEIADPIQLTQTLQQVDAIRIITILFDNAIRAAAKSEKKLVDFSLYENQFAQFIVIGNSTAQAKVDLNQLTAIAHTVTLGRNHHLGLRNLQIILARYPGASNDRSSKDHYFEQRIIIPKKK
ncbi:GHKL domain-containing protein [Limosilactobacillus pontis]|uniref:GHKL domain-containing protein n=1 Tax=Limosilactobacillus pontis TaxID=35787 RepID=A0ABT7UXD8_9LACO|nr:GHKL domain-containing protein [Limosilactobacillus pontis]MDM8266368.1 GHKL domain-containing protein [Limosilactobacillus pontis]